ncbi:carboxymuconolactone decarboxylase family protein [Candidiatus Paracoxiella cheracis]|uniref:carboxymuconolactone decarboxylase family protein n=1 Tax=Candidiatus Paracoxiella cheracis TaxID=3405120 RepID=UPI003BF53F25
MLQEYKNQIPDYAKDLKLNVSNIISESPMTQLNAAQIAGIALASAYATKDAHLIRVFKSDEALDDANVQAAKSAASIMAMNNVYYRFLHLVHDTEYQQMPANLRMNVISNPGISKTDFELYALAVSAINGCGLCMDSHAKVLNKAGVSKADIQHAIRIAAVVNGLAQVSKIEE